MAAGAGLTGLDAGGLLGLGDWIDVQVWHRKTGALVEDNTIGRIPTDGTAVTAAARHMPRKPEPPDGGARRLREQT